MRSSKTRDQPKVKRNCRVSIDNLASVDLNFGESSI